MKVKKMFARDDCIHYKNVRVKICCGRHQMAGVCTIPDSSGNRTHKTCSVKMKHCNYVLKEEEDVHSEELQNSDRG